MKENVKETRITKKEVEYVSKLARLELTDEEKDKYTEQLGSVLKYIEQLKQPGTSGVPPTSHVFQTSNAYREDELKPCSRQIREAILNNAPQREDDFFVVKKVIE